MKERRFIFWVQIYQKMNGLISLLMYSRGYNQSSLSKATSISRSTISKYLNSEQMPTAKSIVNLSYALNCGANELIDFGHMIY